MNSNPPSIDEDPQTNPSGRAPLSEKDFIRNGWSLTSQPFWVWFISFVMLILLVWGSANWVQGFLEKEKRNDPFLEVTNREFSLFLWQFSSFLPMHMPSKSKAGYLPGFLPSRENFLAGTSEEFVSAPPDLIFLYHTWHRLLGSDFIPRRIPSLEFEMFLEQLPEWKPENWAKAPDGYIELVKTRGDKRIENMESLPDTVLPQIVRQAFVGWKNYFIEGEKINALEPSYGQIQEFLVTHPHYARNYWRNISEVNGQDVAGLDYLSGFVEGTFIPDAIVPKDQMAPFLKVALYNAQKGAQN